MPHDMPGDWLDWTAEAEDFQAAALASPDFEWALGLRPDLYTKHEDTEP